MGRGLGVQGQHRRDDTGLLAALLHDAVQAGIWGPRNTAWAWPLTPTRAAGSPWEERLALVALQGGEQGTPDREAGLGVLWHSPRHSWKAP